MSSSYALCTTWRNMYYLFDFLYRGENWGLDIYRNFKSKVVREELGLLSDSKTQSIFTV